MAEPSATVKAHEKYALPLAFANNGEECVTGGFDGSVAAWAVEDWSERVSINAHDQSVNDGTVTTDDQLLTASTDTSLKVWAPSLSDEIQTLTGHTKTVAGVASHPSKPIVASASYDTTVRVWDLEDGTATVLAGHAKNVTNVAFVDGSTLVSGGLGDELIVWSLDAEEEQSRLGGHGQAVAGIATSEPTQVWSVGYNGTVRCWSSDDWTIETNVELPGEQAPNGMAVNQATGTVAITRDGLVTILNADGEVITDHPTPIKGIYHPRWAPDGDMLVVGGADGKIRVYH